MISFAKGEALRKPNESPYAPEVRAYAQLQRQIHHALRAQHPEWIQPDGDCPMCHAYESRLAKLLGLSPMRVGKVGDDRNRKTKTERQVMKKQCSSVVSWLAIYLFAGFMAFCHAANAQESPGITTWGAARGGVPAGVQAPGFMIVFNGQDVGASLLKVCDLNQDGAATLTEVKAALLNWLQQADADKNGALSEVELATALKSLFPLPQPPPGAPPLPEDHALHNLLTKKLMAAVDANNDTWITFNEAIAFVDRNFAKWDANRSGWLDASEFAAAFAQFMPAPSFNSSSETGQRKQRDNAKEQAQTVPGSLIFRETAM